MLDNPANSLKDIYKEAQLAHKLHVTAATRPTSPSTFPSSPSPAVTRGDYSDPDFLTSALHGHDAMLISLAFDARASSTRPPAKSPGSSPASIRSDASSARRSSAWA